jgi:hypothetical protein
VADHEKLLTVIPREASVANLKLQVASGEIGGYGPYVDMSVYNKDGGLLAGVLLSAADIENLIAVLAYHSQQAYEEQ